MLSPNLHEHYVDESGSDQEDLVINSASDLDDDATDMDEIQFSFCKATGSIGNQDNAGHTIADNCGVSVKPNRSKYAIFGAGLGLLSTSVLLLIIFPLYYQQLELGGDEYNAYGAILYLALIVAVILVVLSWICGRKWEIPFYKPPLELKRLLTLATCSGLAGTFLTISSYRRVPCHLQDPLKGAALVYSLVFYFFFCRKVMGLQRIFSATTAVVGLFISVDYGLCDEFRCRGADITSTLTVSAPGSDTVHTKENVGWQGRAIWTLFYVIGVAFWTLHLSLLEGHVITSSGLFPQSVPRMNFLATVSRLVSNSEPLLPEAQNHSDIIPETPKKQPKSIHITLWLHILNCGIFFILGWVDIIPGQGSIKSLSQFWSNTENSFLCHFNIQHEVPDIRSHHETLEYLSNLTPYSIIFNRTGHNLRNKRENHKLFHTKLTGYHEEEDLQTVKNSSSSSNNTDHHTGNMKKVNTEKHLRRYRGHQKKEKHKGIATAHNGTVGISAKSNSSVKISHLILKTNRTGDCKQVRSYGWILIVVYLGFILFLFEFLIISESAVFTVAVVTGALPLIGIFWSMFELITQGTIASIIWSPEITGELICSVLGTPIIFLGLALLFRAHFSDIYNNITSSIIHTATTTSVTQNQHLYNSVTNNLTSTTTTTTNNGGLYNSLQSRIA